MSSSRSRMRLARAPAGSARFIRRWSAAQYYKILAAAATGLGSLLAGRIARAMDLHGPTGRSARDHDGDFALSSTRTHGDASGSPGTGAIVERERYPVFAVAATAPRSARRWRGGRESERHGILTSDNPRTDDPEAIFADIERACSTAKP